MRKFSVGIVATILAVAAAGFAKESRHLKKDTLYFFTWNGSSYDPITTSSSSTPPTTEYCDGPNAQCDGGFSAADITSTPSGGNLVWSVVTPSNVQQIDGQP